MGGLYFHGGPKKPGMHAPDIFSIDTPCEEPPAMTVLELPIDESRHVTTGQRGQRSIRRQPGWCRLQLRRQRLVFYNRRSTDH